MSELPLPLHVPDPLYNRCWDWLVQGLADAAARRQRDDLAQRIEQFRIHPNLQRLMHEAVVEGWRYWMTHSKAPDLVAIIKLHLAQHVPTFAQEELPQVFHRPLARRDLEQAFAIWFHDLGSGLTAGQCLLAARELIEDILHAALSHVELHPFVEANLRWEAAHQRPQPPKSTRFLQARQLARTKAQAEMCVQVTSAHLLAAVLSLPPMQHQSALMRIGLTTERVEREIARMRISRQAGIVPRESAGVLATVLEARVMAWEEDAAEVDDLHLLRAVIVLAMDQQCKEGESLRQLFRQARVAAEEAWMQLTQQGPLLSLEQDPGWLLSTQQL